MNKANAEKDTAVIQEVAVITPMHMLASAVEQGHDLEKIEKLMELERRWKDDKAREAYFEAMAEFNKQGVVITKDKTNSQYGSRYASIGNIANTLAAALAPFGLNATWKIEQGELITATCYLTHTLGHSENVSMSGPPDTSGSKNQLQQIKSTITYLQGSTLQAVTGVIAQDTPDDDGNSGVLAEVITEDQAADLDALREEVGVDLGRFLKWARVPAIDEIPLENHGRCITKLEASR